MRAEIRATIVSKRSFELSIVIDCLHTESNAKCPQKIAALSATSFSVPEEVENVPPSDMLPILATPTSAPLWRSYHSGTTSRQVPAQVTLTPLRSYETWPMASQYPTPERRLLPRPGYSLYPYSPSAPSSSSLPR